MVVKINKKVDSVKYMDFLNSFKPTTIFETLYKEMLDKRILYINDDISDLTIDMVATPILLLNELEKDIPTEKLKPVTIWLSSYGGSADACAFVCETIEKSRIPIHCKVLSIAASAGLYITIACHKRIASKNSIFLLHKGSISLGHANMGEAEDLISFYKDEIGGIFDDLILRRTKITADELKKIRRNETYCLSEKALNKYGFIDEII